MANVAKAMVGVVEKRNLNDVVALLKMQVESLAGHGHPEHYSLLPLVSRLFDLAPFAPRLAGRLILGRSA
jgi:hypothetical protein